MVDQSLTLTGPSSYARLTELADLGHMKLRNYLFLAAAAGAFALVILMTVPLSLTQPSVGRTLAATGRMDDSCYFLHAKAFGLEWRGVASEDHVYELGGQYEGSMTVTAVNSSPFTIKRGHYVGVFATAGGHPIEMEGQKPGGIWTVPCPIRAAE